MAQPPTVSATSKDFRQKDLEKKIELRRKRSMTTAISIPGMFSGESPQSRLSAAPIKPLLAERLRGDSLVVDGFAEIRKQGDLAIAAVASEFADLAGPLRYQNCRRVTGQLCFRPRIGQRHDLIVEPLRSRGRNNAGSSIRTRCDNRQYSEITPTTHSVRPPGPQTLCPKS